MVYKVITAEDIRSGKIPKRGSRIEASNDGINWIYKYFVQLETSAETPFVCVDMDKDIHFPASRGKLYSMMKLTEYEVNDIVLFDSGEGNKFVTRDNMYETKMNRNSRNHYWERTNHAKSIGILTFINNQLRDKLSVDADGVEEAVDILNNLVS